MDIALLDPEGEDFDDVTGHAAPHTGGVSIWGTSGIDIAAVVRDIAAYLPQVWTAQGYENLFSGAAGWACTVMLADDARVQELNRDFRGKDKPTNVLSFPDGETVEEDGTLYLGDIALAFETLEREAREQDKTLQAHVTHLMIHGILHLLGHDHEDIEEAEEMEGIEIKVMAACGLENPYEERG